MGGLSGKTMRISLNLSQHCIETELKSQYNRLVSKALKAKEPDPEMEEALESLQWALQRLDFGLLRSRFPELSGFLNKQVALSTKPGEEIIIYADGKPIHRE
jgi:hypothetical protein